MATDDEYSVRTGWVPRVVCDNDSGLTPKLASALSKAQGEMEGAKKDSSNPAFRSKYADLASVWDAVREPLSKHGLCILQFPCPAQDGQVGLVTTLLHESGESISQVFYMPVKDKTNAQAVGSALTYARRYSLMAVCGIAPEDDDGNSAAGRAPQRPADAPSQDNAKVAFDLAKKFNAAGGVEEQKAVFAEARAAAIPEPHKTSLLTAFSETIKAAQAKGKK